MSWTAWAPIDSSAEYDGPAVYEIRLVASDGNPLPIHRFLDCDDRGLITIGETRNMETRRRQFVCGRDKCYGHSVGNLLYYLLRHSPLNERFQGFKIEYRFREEVDKSNAKQAEDRLIKAYVREFGEVPPLNTSIPDRYGNWERAD